MLFVIALILGIAGAALLIFGKFTLPGGRAAGPTAARLAGGCWVSFLPAALFVRFVLSLFVLPEDLPMAVVHAVVAGVCFFTGAYFLFRAGNAQHQAYPPKHP